MKKLNRKCMYHTGFTLKQLLLIIGTGVFVMLWLTGNLFNGYDYALEKAYNL